MPAARVGVVFPQAELGGDVGAVRAYAQAVTELGYRQIAMYDHVVGADPSVYEGWSGPYDIDTTFHEVLVFCGFLAGITPLELVPKILILPQRQTALVAKQAAEIDLLTGGRFRLGVGIGWNPVEYEALDKNFSNRGARVSEQVELLRRLWSERSVTFEGTYERVTGAGLAPMPIQRPIPIWLGASAESALARAGRIADGWFPMMTPGPQLEHARSIVETAAREAGRDPDAIGMQGQINVTPADVDTVADRMVAWNGQGASHVDINTMKAGLTTVEQHVALLESVASALQ
jgi:probable F420-dependent oxidoreductase